MNLLLVLSCTAPPAVQPNAAELCVEMRPCYEEDAGTTCLVVACGVESSEDCTAGPSHMALATTDVTGLTRGRIRCEDAGGVWSESAPDECPELSLPAGGSFQVQVTCRFDEFVQ